MPMISYENEVIVRLLNFLSSFNLFLKPCAKK